MDIHPIQPILLILFIALLWYMKRKPGPSGAAGAGRATATRSAASRERPGKKEETPEEAFAGLRRQALETKPRSLLLETRPQENEPYGLLMEMGMQDTVVTLACFANGDASLYYQSGGGMVGGIVHESVRKSVKELIVDARKVLPRMTRATSFPLPDSGRVRFYVLTPGGTFTAETDRQALGESGSGLSSLFDGGQEVVTRMRQAQESRR